MSGGCSRCDTVLLTAVAVAAHGNVSLVSWPPARIPHPVFLALFCLPLLSVEYRYISNRNIPYTPEDMWTTEISADLTTRDPSFLSTSIGEERYLLPLRHVEFVSIRKEKNLIRLTVRRRRRVSWDGPPGVGPWRGHSSRALGPVCGARGLRRASSFTSEAVLVVGVVLRETSVSGRFSSGSQQVGHRASNAQAISVGACVTSQARHLVPHVSTAGTSRPEGSFPSNTAHSCT